VKILNKEKKSIFRSNPVILTTKNYHKLVEESNDFWVILVYENAKNNQHFQYIAEVYDEVASKNSHIIKFGVIDVKEQEDLLHFLPYKFQYFPNIFSYLHNEDSELFENFETISPITLQQFIEESFVSKVPLITDDKLKAIVQSAKTNAKLDVSNQKMTFGDLDIQVVILSTKSYIDLVTKDFALTYLDNMKIFQNDMGYYDKFLKILNSSGDYRIYVIYNKVTLDKDNYLLEKQIRNLPLKFSTNSQENTVALQKSFNLLRHISLLRIYSNNYARHCIHKDIEEEDKTEKQMILDFCVVAIETKKNRNQNDNIYKAFLHVIVNKFEARLQNFNKKVKEAEDSNRINLNFGVASIEENPEIKNLYTKFKETKENNNENLNFDENENLFFIINNSNEKFTFKNFKTGNALIDYLGGLDNNEFYEDISFSFEYLPNYEVKNIQNLFVEEKHFSIIKIFSQVLYSQMQSKYVLSYLVMLIFNYFVLKFDTVKFFGGMLLFSMVSGFVLICLTF